ncbi:MAG: DnaD domain protein [Dehalococcoidia bacterium]|nr:DnaD domain protein [Dehalococcoidia bacterium]
MAAPASQAPFEGFRAGQRATALPVQFFTEVLPEIEDATELRVTLYALYAIPRPGRLAALRVSALAAEQPLARALGERAAEATRTAAEAAARRGVLLLLPLEDGDALVLVNNDGGRRLRDRIAAGAEAVPGARVAPRAVVVETSAGAAVYEQEIGLLTPSVGAALAEAEQTYPAGWIADALREAARQNKRSWSYAEAILRRWQTEGRDDEATTGHPGRSDDPYAHLYRRD